MADNGYYVMSKYFSGLMTLFAIGCYACMLAYTILNLPKDLISIAIGVSQFMAGFGGVVAIFFMIVDKEMECLPFRLGEPKLCLMNVRFIMLLNITFGTLIISDPIFLTEQNPTSTSGPIGSVIYQLLIAGASAQGAALLVMAANHGIGKEGS